MASACVDLVHFLCYSKKVLLVGTLPIYSPPVWQDPIMDVVFSIELAEKLDEQVDAIVREMLRLGDEYEGPWPILLDPDYDLDELPALAEKLEISLDVLSQYRLMLDYIDQTAHMRLDDELSPSPEKIAADLSIPFSKFDPYFVRKVQEIRESLIADDDEEVVDSGGGSMPWETKEALLDDLQHDAAMFAPDHRSVKPR